MTLKRGALIGLGILMALIVIICYGKQHEQVMIGINLGLTGEHRAQAESTEKGIVLAKNQLNKTGGVLQRQVKLVTVDNHGKADDAETAVQQLAMRHVVAIIGPNDRQCMKQAENESMAKQIPMICPVNTDNESKLPREIPNYAFQMASSDSQQGAAMALFLWNDCHLDNAAILYDTDFAFADAAVGFKNTWEGKKGKVALYQAISDRSDEAILSALRTTTYQVIYLSVSRDKAKRLIPLLRENGIKSPIAGNEEWGRTLAAEINPMYLQHLYYTAQYATDVKDIASEAFAEAFYEMYGELPDAYAALGYDSVMLLAKAMEMKESTEAKDIIAALELIAYEGAAGRMTFDDYHQGNKPSNIMVYWQQEPALLQRQVVP